MQVLRRMDDPRDGIDRVRESEERFRLAFEAAPIGMTLVGLDGRFLRANAALCRLLGLTEEELVGRSFQEITHPDDVAVGGALAAKLFGGEIPSFQLAKRYLRKDGSAVDTMLTTSLVRDAAGHPLYAIGQIEDLSARRSAEAALRRSEAQYRELVEQAPEPVFIADLDGRYQQVNDAACHLLGYTRDELLGKTILDIIPPEDVPRLASAKELLSGDEQRVQVAEWTLRRKDGSVVPVEACAKIHADGRWVAFVRDLSARKRTEEALRRTEESLAQAQRAAHLGTWEWDLLTHQVQRSPELFVLFGVDPDAIEPRRWSLAQYLHPDDRERVLHETDVAAREGRPYTIEHRIVRPDGVERIVLQHGEPIVERGRPVRMIGTLLDITERRQLERLRAEWAAVVAHDLRQPLNSIALQAQLLRRTLHAPGDDVQSTLEHIVSAARRLDRMIGDLTDLSKLDARRLELARRPTDIARLVHDARDLFALEAPERTIVVRTSGTGFQADVDPDRFVQILENLVSNAIKYGEPQTPVVIDVVRTADDLSVAVTNSGPGIRAEELPLAFTRFQRLSTAKGSRVKGTGLGLYITRQLVEAHGGQLLVESKPGETTTFRVVLPI